MTKQEEELARQEKEIMALIDEECSNVMKPRSNRKTVGLSRKGLERLRGEEGKKIAKDVADQVYGDL